MRATISWIISASIIVTGLSGMVAVAVPQPVSAACQNSLLTFPAWHKGLTKANCEIKDIKEPVKSTSNEITLRGFIIRVILNITEMILQLVGYAAVVMLIIGGFRYLTSAGEEGRMKTAKQTILNAVIGLLISIFSIAIVNVVAGALR